MFDLDGTLVDTVEDIAAAVNAALAALGFPMRKSEEMHRMVGNGMRNLIVRAVPEGTGPAVVDECAKKATEAYAEKPAVSTRPYPGVEALLDGLEARGVPFSIISNKPDALTRLVVDAVFPGRRFSAVHGERSGVPRKPDPSAALSLAALMGVGPEEVVYLGDSDVDMITAKNAGFLAFGAAWGFRGRKELESAGADRIIERAEELLSLF